jgi:hypothetical protein
MTVKELRELARERGVYQWYKLNKAELESALQRANRRRSPPKRHFLPTRSSPLRTNKPLKGKPRTMAFFDDAAGKIVYVYT